MILQLLNFIKNINLIRDKSETSPNFFIWMTLALITLITSMSYFYSYVPSLNRFHLSIWVLMGISFVDLIVSNIYLGIMLSWGLNRQAQKKSWGVQLPNEPHTGLFRPGVWSGFAVGMLYETILIGIGEILWIVFHFPIGLMIINGAGVVGFIFTINLVRIFYQVPKRYYLFLFSAMPLLAISFFGMILAIVMGEIHQYEQAAKNHEKPSFPSSAIAHPTNPPIMANMPHDRITPAQASSIGHPASNHSFSKRFMQQRPETSAPRMVPLPARSFVNADQHCMGGLPMRLPQQSAWYHTGTVIDFVPRPAAVSSMFRTQRIVHGFLDPEYLMNQRVLIHPSGTNPYVRFLAIVPNGMMVQVGQIVEVASAHASHHYACRYAPNLIVR